LDYIKEIQQGLEQETLTAKQKSIFNLFVCLSVIEGTFSEIANIIIFMLYQSNGLKRRYRQVRQTNLASKMQFLEENGFGALAKTANRTLRNSIAHLEIAVNADGSVFDVKTKQQIELKHQYQRMRLLFLNIVSLLHIFPKVQETWCNILYSIQTN
jgi:hypothetical protein